MTTPVSFKLAIVLKDKGFDERCSMIYYDGTNELRGESHFLYSRDIKAPTIAEVVTWLYEKHGIWVEVQHCGTFGEFGFKISRLDNERRYKNQPHYMHPFGKGFNNPTEAYMTAFEYTLNNLI